MRAETDLGFLGTLPYFHGLAIDELARIADRCHRRVLGNGEIIVVEGQPADGLYVVRSGAVRVFKTSILGKEQVLLMLGSGETFNDVPVFDGGPSPASVRAAATGTSVHLVPIALVKELLVTSPQVAANVVQVLAGRLRHLTTVVEDLAFHPITKRVARLLLTQSAAAGGAISLTKEEMAARVGSAREVVSRALRTLEQQGAITRQHNRIVAVNEPVLRALLDPIPERGHNT